MKTDKVLESLRTEITSTEANLVKLKQKITFIEAMQSLATKSGFTSIDEAYASAGGEEKKQRVKRTPITDDMKVAITADLKAGGMTVRAIAEKYGISMPSVNGIKSKAGLTHKKSKKKTAAKV